MTIEQAFLKDIVTRPDDDPPRLVYADWLEDHGDADRATFIRAQCRLRTLGPFDPERYDLEATEAELLAKHEKKWKKPLAKITARCELGRGFVEKVALPVAKFVRVAEGLFDLAPVRELRPLQIGLGWDELPKCEGLAKLRTLDLSYSRPGLARAQSLARSPHVANLRELDLASGKITNRGAQALAASPHLANLRELNLHSNGLTDAGVEHLTASAHLHDLTALDLTGNELSAAAFSRLVRWKQAERIEELCIGNDTDTEPGPAYEELLSRAWPALRKLNLDRARLSERALKRLAGPCFSALRELRVAARERADAGVRAILESPHLGQLEALDLFWGPKLSDGAARALASSPLLKSLRSLKVAISPGAFALLVRKGALRRLHELVLSEDGDRLAAEIARADLPELRRLSLGQADLGDAGVIALAGAANLSGLRELELTAGRVGNAGVQALIASPHLGRLHKLRMSDAPHLLAEADLERLRERFGASLVLG
jgi:uncharacterized protein (TIGR02996 family)